jgi:phospho-N-acetylmuramoyl-pentapeptide-transferase
MLIWLTEYLTRFHTGFNVFSYLTMRAILGALTALVLSFALGSVFDSEADRTQRVGQPIRTSVPSLTCRRPAHRRWAVR